MGTGQSTTHMIDASQDEKQIYTTNVDSGTVSLFENVLLQPTVPPTGALPPHAKPRMDWIQNVIPVARGNEGFDVSPDVRELWTANPDGTFSIILISEKKVTATLNSKVSGLRRLKFTPDGKRVLVVSVRTGDLLIYDTQSRKELKRLNIGRGAAILIAPDGLAWATQR